MRDVGERFCVCHERILTGMSDDWCALIVTVDPYPLNPYGELVARLQGRATYDLRREGDHFRLYQRDHWHITGRPAGTVTPGWRCDVVADHWCDVQLPSIPSVYDAATTTLDPDQPPPF